MQRQSKGLGTTLERFSRAVSRWTGSSRAFAFALGTILLWAATGPLFGFSDTWQLVINTGTTIVTFLMVFLIQRAQNKEMSAIALKLNEVVAALEGASNRLIDIEDLSEGELETLHLHFRRLSEMARHERSLTKSHTVEEAQARHEFKMKSTRR
jgi:low affinity Fe/Cu permease